MSPSQPKEPSPEADNLFNKTLERMLSTPPDPRIKKKAKKRKK